MNKSQSILVSSNRQNTTERSKTFAASFDEDTAIFIALSQENKKEGNNLFQRRDHEGAMIKYKKALNLLPKNHIDAAYLRTSMAACFMQMGVSEYPSAINECNLALEVCPKYSKALLKRAKCYEALSKFDLAWNDVNDVLIMEPNNQTALEVMDSIMMEMDNNDICLDDKFIKKKRDSIQNNFRLKNIVKEKIYKKRAGKGKICLEVKEVKDKEMVVNTTEDKCFNMNIKLLFGDDIRCTQVQPDCSIFELREAIKNKFLGLKGVLVKYMDHESDLITITSTEELRYAESLFPKNTTPRYYIVEVSCDQEPSYQERNTRDSIEEYNNLNEQKSINIDEWIVQFARMFRNHVGFDSDSYLDLHNMGMKLYSEAMEDLVSTEEAQKLFDTAIGKFQEMAALALFNWGNVHLSKARKRTPIVEDDHTEKSLNSPYEWANKEYENSMIKYQEAVKIKPNFFEGYLALSYQHFEQAKVMWYFSIASNVDIQGDLSEKVLCLYNKAEEFIEIGTNIWEKEDEKELHYLMNVKNHKEDVVIEEAKNLTEKVRSQINLLWGTILYERSLVEYELELPTWGECLEVSMEKFELCGASSTDIAFMVKNHVSNCDIHEGMGFKINEIVHAWNEIYDVKRWDMGVSSFRLEPLFRRRSPNIKSLLGSSSEIDNLNMLKD